MKKLLLTAAITTALLSSLSALACEGCGPEVKVVPVVSVTTVTTENQFYGKIEGGLTFLNKAKYDLKDQDEYYKKTKSLQNIQLKAKSTGTFGVGVGYYLTDNIRTDLTFNMIINPKFKKSWDFKTLVQGILQSRGTPIPQDVLDDIPNGKINLKIKRKVMATLLNGYVDLFDLGATKFFAGAGVGWAQIKEGIIISEPTFLGIKNDKFSMRKANNFAYQLSLGSSVDLTDNIKGELSYNWKDYGKSSGKSGKDKKNNKDNKVTYPKTHYRTHNIMAGLRFSM